MTKSEALNIFNRHYQEIGTWLVELLADELEKQGHRASGNLINSIRFQVQNLLNEIEIEFSFNKYGIFQDRGIKAKNIPFGKGGGRTSRFIAALIAWVKLKKFTSGLDKDVKSAAFAIAKKMKKEGMPTKGAFRFSKNGRRIGWLTHTVNKNEKAIFNRMDLATEELVSNVLDSELIRLEQKFSHFIIL